VAEHRTKLGKCDVMTQNPANAIMHLGHGNGTVTLWSPNMTTPLVKMQCHRGPVTAMAIDHAGKYMATAGLDGQLKLWDLRSYKPMQEYYTPTPASSLSISQRGLLAVGFGSHVSVWKSPFTTKQTSPYMSHLQPGSPVHDVQFVPFEDVLGFGHRAGMSSIIVPGAGEANFDALEANPFQTKKQRQEMEVHALLDKIQPEMITLDVEHVGKMDKAPTQVINKEKKEAWAAANPEEAKELKFRARGKNSSSRRHLRKKAKNVVDQKKVRLIPSTMNLQLEIKQEKTKGSLLRLSCLESSLDADANIVSYYCFFSGRSLGENRKRQEGARQEEIRQPRRTSNSTGSFLGQEEEAVDRLLHLITHKDYPCISSSTLRLLRPPQREAFGWSAMKLQPSLKTEMQQGFGKWLQRPSTC